MDNFIKQKVHNYYWTDDINCATTTLKILAEVFKVEINSQVIDSALGMHGAGEYGAQCGLVEGTLMFIGIYGKYSNISESVIVKSCKEFAKQYEKEFKSLQCSELRPEGFKEDNPPHICEPLTSDAVKFAIEFIKKIGK
jgi:C_GCAxxG_C_C family probable redox protein